jgi:amino acid transporter
MNAGNQSRLVRAIGRWTLVALVVNGIIGSGIFGLPDDVARLVGRAAPLAYLLAALGIGVIMACFAEVASRFTEAGGPYLYARKAFGRLVGIQIGWFAWLVRLTSAAANANLFVVYFGEFFPAATRPMPRAAILTVLIGLLAIVNIRGVKSGASVSNAFTVAKLLPLIVFIVAGLALVGGRISIGGSAASAGNWLQAVLVLIFAYGGFEAALMPMGEAKEPRRDAPFALFMALIVVTVVYMLVHLVVMGAITDPAAFNQPEVRERPLAEAARVFLGGGGAALIALGVLVSTYGYLAGQFVSVPRLTFAFAEQRDFPKFFAAVHKQFRTPYVSILVYSALVWGLAIYGSFIWNAILSAVARLFTYGLVCAALLRLRRMEPEAASFRLPAGWLAAFLGMAFCALMVTQMGSGHLKIVLVIAAVALLNWLWVRSKTKFGDR